MTMEAVALQNKQMRDNRFYNQRIPFVQQNSTESNGSVESFMTQVPLPYHSIAGSGLPSDYRHAPFATPDLTNPATFGLGGNGMNPASEPYTPGVLGSSRTPAGAQVQNMFPAGANSMPLGQYHSQGQYQAPHGTNMGSIYGNNGQYGGMGPNTGQGQGGMQYQQPSYSTQADMSRISQEMYNTYGPTPPIGGNGFSNQYGGPVGGAQLQAQQMLYGQGNGISPSYQQNDSFNGMMSPDFNQNAFGGVHGPMAYGNHQGGPMGMQQGYGSQYSHGQAQQYQPPLQLVKPMNANRGRSSQHPPTVQSSSSTGSSVENSHNAPFVYSQGGGGQQKMPAPKSDASQPKRKMSRKQLRKFNKANPTQVMCGVPDGYQGGPVRFPANGPVATSPAKSKAASLASRNSRASSQDRRSEVISVVASVNDSIPEEAFETESEGGDQGVTPSARPRDHKIVSETRADLKTPTLRRRGGQSIANTDPAQKVTAWAAGVADSATKPPPPKMGALSLMAAGGIDPSTLATIDEGVAGGDVFTGQSYIPARVPASAQRMQGGNVNIFGPSPSHQLTPYVPHQTLPRQQGMSRLFSELTANGTNTRPSIDMALDPKYLPFMEYARAAKEDSWGVIKIKNIPYNVNRPEVLAFLGRNARIISEAEYEPVHIVMERVTSKTLDCYVEFINFNEAVAAVNRFETNRNGGRGGRLGQRHVEVELSSQDQLMKELFPKAKNVLWHGSHPEIIERDMNDPYNSGFQGFISSEELIMLVKHVETPQRSPFSKDCPQRPFECLISTLLKYPWYMVDYITIDDRKQLYETTMTLLDLLIERVQHDNESTTLTPMLLKRVWRAAVKCHGFTSAMKDNVIMKARIPDDIAAEMGIGKFACDFQYLWTVGQKMGTPDDLILWYGKIIREVTEPKGTMTLAERAAHGEDNAPPKLFGPFASFCDYPKDDISFRSLTLGQVAKSEWAAIEAILRQRLTPALEG